MLPEIPMMVFGLAPIVWLALQVYAWRSLRGVTHTIGAVLAMFMIGIWIFTIFAYMAQSNLWPLTLLFVSPFGVLAIALLLAVDRLLPKR